MNELNFSTIIDPVIEKAIGLDRTTVTRVVHIVTPYLCFCPQISNYSQWWMGAADVLTNVIDTDWSSLSQEDMQNRAIQIGLLTTATAMNILKPAISSIYSPMLLIISDGASAIDSLKKGNYSSACQHTLMTGLSSVQLSAAIYESSGLIAASLLVTATRYLTQAYSEFYKNENSWLQLFEAMSHTVLAGITINNAVPHLQDTYQNWGKKQLTQEKVDLFETELFAISDDREILLEEVDNAGSYTQKSSKKELQNSKPNRKEESEKLENSLQIATQCEANHRLEGCDIPLKVRVHDWLLENGYSNHLKDLDIRFPSNTYWDNITFENCSLSHFKDVAFKDVTFNRCNVGGKGLNRMPWVNKSLFISCLFGEEFVPSQHGSFTDCVLLGCANMSSLARTLTDKKSCLFLSNKGETIDTRFFGLELADTPVVLSLEASLEDLNLNHLVTRPVSPTPIARITIPAYEEDHGPFATSIAKTLRELRGRILYAPREVKDEDFLAHEVCATLAEYIPNSEQSRAQFLFNHVQPGSAVAKVLSVAQHHLECSQGLMLPGGPHVCEVFYKPLAKAKKENIGQTTLELAYIHIARTLRIPTFGICRGVQLGNVYHGGTLKTIPHQQGFNPIGKVLKFRTSKYPNLGTLFRKRMATVYSSHFQAIDKLGHKLRVYGSDLNGIIKCIQTPDGQFVGTQFHPEIGDQLDENTKEFINLISPIMRTAGGPGALHDVLDFHRKTDNHDLYERLADIIKMLDVDIGANREIFKLFIERAAEYSPAS